MALRGISRQGGSLAAVGGLVVVVVLCAPQRAAAEELVMVAPLVPLGVDRREAAKVERWIAASTAELARPRLLSGKRVHARLRAAGAGCLQEPSCLARAARTLSATQVLSGEVGSAGRAHVLYLRLRAAADGSLLRAESAVLDPKKGVRGPLLALLTKLLDPRRYVGELAVASNVASSWVYLDGRRVGRGRTLVLKQVGAGTHALRLTHPEHQDFVRFVSVPFRARARIMATMVPLKVARHQMKFVAGEPLTSAELPWYRRWWAVAAFGAVIFAAATTTAALLPKDPASDHALTIIRP